MWKRRMAWRDSRWRMLPLAVVLASIFSLTSLGAGQAAEAAPPPLRLAPAEESLEDAMVAMLPYLLQDDEMPDGYFRAATQAIPNYVQALDSAIADRADGKQVATTFANLTRAGRLLRATHNLAPVDLTVRPIAVTTDLYTGSSQATLMVGDPAQHLGLKPSVPVTPRDAPTLGEQASAYHVELEQADARTIAEVIVWRRGRLVFTIIAARFATDDQDVSPAALALATRWDARLARLAPFPDFTVPLLPTMPDQSRRLNLYWSLLAQLPRSTILGRDYRYLGLSAVSNLQLLLDTRDSGPGLDDPRATYQRVVVDEQYVLGATMALIERPPAGSPLDANRARISYGYHVFADRQGARTALAADPREIGQRMTEEINIGRGADLTLAETSTDTDLGVPRRTLKGRIVTVSPYGAPTDLTTVRWVRGNVELFVNAATPPGKNVEPQIQAAIDSLHASLGTNPFPSR